MKTLAATDTPLALASSTPGGGAHPRVPRPLFLALSASKGLPRPPVVPGLAAPAFSANAAPSTISLSMSVRAAALRLSERYGVDDRRTARAIVGSAALDIVTFKPVATTVTAIAR